jgi:hypothetical protein|tara:strand:+ start:157 stop:291 length:135 start_codon:yes stop_codon:yes gene_type:complete
MKEKQHIKEELSPDDMKKIRLAIRKEIARVFFDLYRKKGAWTSL